MKPAARAGAAGDGAQARDSTADTTAPTPTPQAGISEAASESRPRRGRPLSGPVSAGVQRTILSLFPEITTTRHRRTIVWAFYGANKIDDDDDDSGFLHTLPRLHTEHHFAVSVFAQLGRLAWAGVNRDVLRGWAREINDDKTLSIKQAESILRGFLREAQQ